MISSSYLHEQFTLRSAKVDDEDSPLIDSLFFAMPFVEISEFERENGY